MSTPESKPVTKRMLNRILLPIAGAVLILLALLFMATPLLRQTRRFQAGGNLVTQGNGPTFQQGGPSIQGSGPQGPGSSEQGSGPRLFSDQGGAPQVFSTQGDSNLINRRLMVGIGLLGGRNGPIIFFIALVLSLVAAVGMFLARRWGQILGIFMAVLYVLAGVVSLLPLLLFRFQGLSISPSLILGVAEVLLALAVIVLALIPAKKVITPVVSNPPTVAV